MLTLTYIYVPCEGSQGLIPDQCSLQFSQELAKKEKKKINGEDANPLLTQPHKQTDTKTSGRETAPVTSKLCLYHPHNTSIGSINTIYQFDTLK